MSAARKTGRVVARVAAVLGGMLVILLAWGFAIEPHLLLDEEREVATVPGLPSAWEGQRVAVMGDLQIGLWLDNTDLMREAAEAVVAGRPAALLFTGDFVYHTVIDDTESQAAALRQLEDVLRPLVGAGIPVYAVLGNHDYSVAHQGEAPSHELAAHVERTLEQLGVRVLRNEAVPLPAPGHTGAEGAPADGGSAAPLYLVGIGSAWAERADVGAALAALPDGAAHLTLMHNPYAFADFPAGTAPFAVAGHTHGGQVRIPLLPDWSWLTFARTDPVHADGWIPEYGAPGNTLYVNRGIGMSFLPIRINCPPELTWFELRRPATAPTAASAGAGGV